MRGTIMLSNRWPARWKRFTRGSMTSCPVTSWLSIYATACIISVRLPGRLLRRTDWIIFSVSFVLGSDRGAGGARLMRVIFGVHSFSVSFVCFLRLSFAFISQKLVTNLGLQWVFG